MKIGYYIALIIFISGAQQTIAAPYSVMGTDYNIFVEQRFTRSLEAGLEDGDGDLRMTTSQSRLWHERAWQQGHIEVGVGYEYVNHEFNGLASPIGIGKTWTFDIGLVQRIRHEFSFLAKVEFDFSREDSATFMEGFYFTGFFGGAYEWTDRFTISFGLYYQTELEDEDIILPVAGIDWKVTDRLRFRTANGMFLSYDFFGDTRSIMEVNFQYNSRQYRSDNKVHAVRRRELSAGISYKHYVMDFFYLQGTADWIVHRKFKTRHDGADIATTDVGDSLRLGFVGGFEF